MHAIQAGGYRRSAEVVAMNFEQPLEVVGLEGAYEAGLLFFEGANGASLPRSRRAIGLDPQSHGP